MASNAQSVSARRAKAISLIQSGLVHSQSDLVILLKKLDTKSHRRLQVEILKRLVRYGHGTKMERARIKFVKVQIMRLCEAPHCLQS